MNPVVPGSGILILKLALSLGLVVGLILALQKVARRYGHALGAGGGAETIRMITQRSVGPRLSLAVVEVRGRTLLVGISPQGIHAVADLDGTPAPALAPATAPAATAVLGLAASGPAASADETIPPTPTSTAPSAPASLVLPGPATMGGLLARLGLRPRGAAALAPVPVRANGPVRPAPGRGHAAPVAFEDELRDRLASIRDRYPSLTELESGSAEAWQ